MVTLTNVTPIVCNLLYLLFRNQHRDIDHGIPKLECEKCGKQFSKQWKMKAHVCTIQCDHCDKVYPTRNGLFSHIRTAHPGMG